MLRRLAFYSALIGLGAGTAVLVWGAFITPHQATGTVNTAVSTSDFLYICQPSLTTTSPQCPIDTDGADETIYAANEDLLPGQVEWQKIRVTNTGSDPWDILSMGRVWTETADPGSDCETIPEAVVWRNYSTSLTTGQTTYNGLTGPGVTILGNSFANYSSDPFGTNYSNSTNDNHGTVNSSQTYPGVYDGGYASVHVAPSGFEDLLLGIRLPIGTPDTCLDVVWTLSTTWTIQLHTP